LKNNILHSISVLSQKSKKQLAILVDPDKGSESHIKKLCINAKKANANFFLVGGSLLTNGDIDNTISILKQHTELPVIIFPGSSSQISKLADGILFLSLLSSRNPEMLIGQQVISAPYLKKTTLEIISTAYLLIDSGEQTTASYISNSQPIPANKSEIAACTALAGEYMGMDLIYLDGGSGAKNPVSAEMISKVKSYTSNPIIIGGGINSITKAKTALNAGADVIVVGNAIERDQDFCLDLGNLISELNA
jgi:putative glycerol-1-phosphate prenyltransferase